MEKDKGISKQRVSDFPELAAQWHPTKNSPILPGQVAASSPKKFWWKCDKGPDHEWETRVNSRATDGNGCPFCSNRRLSVTNSLAIVNPEIAAQWHPTKNGDVKPFQVTASSGEKFWWKCDTGPDHEWETVVRYRAIRGAGCPFCSNDRGSATNSLESLYPDIAAQWHPSKNGFLTPAQVPVGSAKKYWWKCNKGPDHEWDAQVNGRVDRGYGCPFCAVLTPTEN